MGLNSHVRDNQDGKKEFVGLPPFLFETNFGFGEDGEIVVVVGEGVVVPEVVLLEDQSQKLVVLVAYTVLEGCFPDFDDGVDVFQDGEGFSPESQFLCGFELLNPDFDVFGVDISFFYIDIDIFFLIVPISFIEDIL